MEIVELPIVSSLRHTGDYSQHFEEGEKFLSLRQR
jgi:hypothetical protein